MSSKGRHVAAAAGARAAVAEPGLTLDGAAAIFGGGADERPLLLHGPFPPAPPGAPETWAAAATATAASPCGAAPFFLAAAPLREAATAGCRVFFAAGFFAMAFAFAGSFSLPPSLRQRP